MIRWLAMAALVFLAAHLRAAEPGADAAERNRATIDLVDGSRLIGAPEEATLAVSLDYGQLEIPLKKIRHWEPAVDGHGVVICLANGDRLTGTLERRDLRIDTLVGTLSPAIDQIRKVAYAVWREGDMPAGKPGLAFGGVNWQTWRTEFAVERDRLRSLPKPQVGFRYGHEGHGRGPGPARACGCRGPGPTRSTPFTRARGAAVRPAGPDSAHGRVSHRTVSTAPKAHPGFPRSSQPSSSPRPCSPGRRGPMMPGEIATTGPAATQHRGNARRL